MDFNSINHIGSNNKLESGSDQNGVIQPLLTGLLSISVVFWVSLRIVVVMGMWNQF